MARWTSKKSRLFRFCPRTIEKEAQCWVPLRCLCRKQACELNFPRHGQQALKPNFTRGRSQYEILSSLDQHFLLPVSGFDPFLVRLLGCIGRYAVARRKTGAVFVRLFGL